MKNIRETSNYLIEEINQNEIMSKKYKNVFSTLDYIKELLILASTITGCVFISALTSLFCIPASITSSPAGIKIC